MKGVAAAAVRSRCAYVRAEMGEEEVEMGESSRQLPAGSQSSSLSEGNLAGPGFLQGWFRAAPGFETRDPLQLT